MDLKWRETIKRRSFELVAKILLSMLGLQRRSSSENRIRQRQRTGNLGKDILLPTPGVGVAYIYFCDGGFRTNWWPVAIIFLLIFHIIFDNIDVNKDFFHYLYSIFIFI
jgi:hypothetical protein